MAEPLRVRIAKLIGGSRLADKLASVSVRVDDSPGWGTLTGRPHDYDQSKVMELYQDALTAWRKNPIAWRIIAITTDYVVGDVMKMTSPNRALNKYITDFWHHPKNNMDLRLEGMCEELSRAGDLFIAIFQNDQDGMSYIRFVTKDRIMKIETSPNDWETEIAYYEVQDTGEPRKWLSPANVDATKQDAVMMHYSVNKPIGALLGEGDLTTMIPWLLRYSRMLEDRVRLHWAVRAFLWLVTVPANKVKEKQEQYRVPPESGSIVVKDESEKWEAVTPLLRGADASHDMKSVRGMIDAGSGYPPHWRGESGDANLATAQAMQTPTERHLLRRQRYFGYILQDIIYQGYQRAVGKGRARKLGTNDYSKLFTMNVPDIRRSENEALAKSAQSLATALKIMAEQLPGKSDTLNRLLLKMVFRNAGEPQGDDVIEQILKEAHENETQEEPEEEPEEEPKEVEE